MPAILNFSAVFLVVFAGMAFAHLLAYGDAIFQFKDATAAFYSMYRVLAGDFNFIALYTPPAPTSITDFRSNFPRPQRYDNNRIVGPAFFIVWSMVGLTVMFNMFVSIIMESYVPRAFLHCNFVTSSTPSPAVFLKLPPRIPPLYFCKHPAQVRGNQG